MLTGRTPHAVPRYAIRIISTLLLSAVALGAGAMAGGCAHAEFDIVHPPDLAQHVGTKTFVTVPVDPIEYQMIAYEDHLVIHAYNRSPEPVHLLAERSTVVDPHGQSHPLAARNQTILPGTYARLVLPPVRGWVAATGPTIGIGFGASYGYGWHHYHGYYPYYGAYGYYPYFYDYPRYYAVYGGDDANLYWGWPDGGQVRLVLVYLPNLPDDGPTPTTGPAAPLPATEPAGPATRPSEVGPPGVGPPPPTFSHEFVFVRKNV